MISRAPTKISITINDVIELEGITDEELKELGFRTQQFVDDDVKNELFKPKKNKKKKKKKKRGFKKKKKVDAMEDEDGEDGLNGENGEKLAEMRREEKAKEGYLQTEIRGDNVDNERRGLQSGY